MRKSLGSLLLIIISLWGESDYFDFNLSVDNPSPFVKEGVIITFKAHQKNHKNSMFFELTPPKNSAYRLQLIDKKDNVSAYHDKYVTYRYRLYPLKEGNISLPFLLQVATVSDESVKAFVTGSWDEVNPMAKTTYTPHITPLTLQVKAIKKVDLVGDFTLSATQIPSHAEAYEQINITYTLQGEGYPELPKELLQKQPKVEQFLEQQNPTPKTHLYNYALLSQEDFTLPDIILKAFSPKKNHYYTLRIPAKKISISPLKTQNILDKKENFPSKSAIDITALLKALALFIAGYLTAILKPWALLKKAPHTLPPLKEEIARCKDPKSLLKLLLSEDSQRYQEHIKALESLLYHDSKQSFASTKEQLLKQL